MKKLLLISSLLAITSCVSALSHHEEKEYAMYEKKNLQIETKSKGVGVGLGFLPGGGSFYTGHIMIGVADLLTWPLSILWDPFNGYNGAQKINYDDTKDFINKKKESEIRDLTLKFENGALNQQKYTIEKQKIEDKYSPNF